MNAEDFKNVIAECLQNPDKLIDHADKLNDEFKTVIEANEALKQEVEGLKEKNNDLRDSNVKLLLRQSFAPEKEIEEKKETKEETINNFLKKLKGN